MSGVTWSKFYWSDWANDPKLKVCSLAAQGLWMRLLCIASEAEPFGYVKINGDRVNPQDMATLIGRGVEELEPLLRELKAKGVCSVTEDGTLYCRRMLRDMVRLEEYRKYGKRGGNPNLPRRYRG